MKKNNLFIAMILFGLVGLMSCQQDTFESSSTEQLSPQLPSAPFTYPKYLSELTSAGHVPNFGGQNINVTDLGAQLGRVLFYDPQLSLNNRIACASCHHQALGFAESKPMSMGFAGKMTSRNSMAIVNIAGNNNLFWDSRTSSLTELALMPIRDHVEMGMEAEGALSSKLSKIKYYPELFRKAFGNETITEERIALALAQFMASMVSFNSKFDKGIKNEFAEFTPLEKMGKELFFSAKTQCSSCHAGPDFSAPDFPRGPYSSPTVAGTANIGLDLVYKDNGKRDGQFKIPSLRNIALTAPYMHDGRFKTLMEVIEHYDNKVVPHHNLDGKLRAGTQAKRLGLNPVEKQALVAFLMTLTDQQFVNDQRYSSPFKH
jgi:cytochrome c peroxidase